MWIVLNLRELKMPSKKKYLLWLLLLLYNPFFTTAQIDSTAQVAVDTTKTPSPAGPDKFDLDTLNKPPFDSIFQIRKIYITGNKITRKIIITRELPFQEGDTVNINHLPALFARGKSQILSLSLFSTSDRDFGISVAGYDGHFMDIMIKVKERLYILPFPYLKPVDRSLSEWLFQNKAQISRLDYGLKLTYYNLTGNNDKIKFQFITGYTKQLTLNYNRPYIDKRQTWGLNIGYSIGKTHEINVATNCNDNTTIFIKDKENYLRNFTKAFVELTHRPALYTTHTFGIGYQSLKVGDTVLRKNPYFFKNGLTTIKFPEIYYKLAYQKLNLKQYPTKGFSAELQALKQGINSDINVWQITAKGIGYWPTKIPLTFYSISALGTIKFPLSQPFYNSQLLGYGDLTMSGYEYYVIDGTAGGLIKATLFRQITNFSIKPPIFKSKLASLIPFNIYGKVFSNAGYAYNREPWASRLNNRLLYGIGIGFDIFTDYDFTLKLEFSINHTGNGRFYTDKKTTF